MPGQHPDMSMQMGLGQMPGQHPDIPGALHLYPIGSFYVETIVCNRHTNPAGLIRHDAGYIHGTTRSLISLSVSLSLSPSLSLCLSLSSLSLLSLSRSGTSTQR